MQTYWAEMRCLSRIQSFYSFCSARHQSHDTPSQPRLQRLSERLNGEREKKLKRGNTERGDCISADHYISAVPGRLEHTYGREKQGYTCGTLFVDHATSKSFNFCQYTALETVTNKHRLELLAKQEGFQIKAYRSDNGIFAAKEFKKGCELLEQTISFSGVRATPKWCR